MHVVYAVVGAHGSDTRVFVLLDLASELTLIKSWATDLLGLDGPYVFRSIGTANGPSPTKSFKRVDLCQVLKGILNARSKVP